MSGSTRIIAVLDANILYPAPLRDFMLRMAEAKLYIPKWSDEIHDEWTRNVLIDRPDLKPAQLARTRQFMDQAFEEANVKGYKSLIEGLTLPDKDDRHVLAVGIKSESSVIITFNKKDFPTKSVKPFSINIQDPDEFVGHLMQLNQAKVLEAFYKLVYALKNPPQTQEQVLATLEKCGLKKSVGIIRKAIPE